MGGYLCYRGSKSALRDRERERATFVQISGGGATTPRYLDELID